MTDVHANKAANKSTTVKKPATASKEIPAEPKLSVGREFLDVTWRMTTPVVIFALLGILGDVSFGSKPWLTLLGTVIGFYFAIQLVKRQINRGNPGDRE